MDTVEAENVSGEVVAAVTTSPSTISRRHPARSVMYSMCTGGRSRFGSRNALYARNWYARPPRMLRKIAAPVGTEPRTKALVRRYARQEARRGATPWRKAKTRWSSMCSATRAQASTCTSCVRPMKSSTFGMLAPKSPFRLSPASVRSSIWLPAMSLEETSSVK